MELLNNYDVLVVPGGGVFADAVRKVYKSHALSEKAAHSMAILAMCQYGTLLSDISDIEAVESLEEVHAPCIFLPYNLMSRSSALEPSWDVTSDTIACYIAKELNAERFVILTDVGGIYLHGKILERISAEELSRYGETCVDRGLPRCLLENKMNCLVVDGGDLEKVKRAMEGEETGTLIIGGE